jgi:hypothetical protein
MVDTRSPQAAAGLILVRHIVLAALALTLLLALPAAPAKACTAGTALCPGATKETPDAARRAPRIIFGETQETDFQFRPFRPLRRSGASSRRAYFGSGEAYSATLARLQAQLQAIDTRAQLEGLELTPAQEAAKNDIPPALARALAASKHARREGVD